MWRGIHRDAQVAGDSWPKDLSGLKKLWSCEMSDSYSGPIISRGTVFSTETLVGGDEALFAFESQTGQKLWQRQWPAHFTVTPFAQSHGNWIRSTPAADGDRIVVCGMRDLIACFQCQNGEEVWRVDFAQQPETRLPAYGTVCSPLIDGEHVYVQAGGAVRCIRMADGHSVWTSLPDEGGLFGGNFSSPIIAPINGVRQLVVQTRTDLAGLALLTGEVLWRQPTRAFRGMNILTPLAWQEKIFVSANGGRSQLLAIEKSDGAWAIRQLWTAKAEGYMSTPVVVDDHLYLHLKNGRLACLDLASGQEKWRTTPFGSYWSMIVGGDQILALVDSGDLLLIQADPRQFRMLDRTTISQEPCWAHLALSNDKIFIRSQRGLNAYQWI